MFFGFWFGTYALKFGDAGKISVIVYTEVIFGYLIDILVVGTVPEFWSLVGSSLITLCIINEFYTILF